MGHKIQYRLAIGDKKINLTDDVQISLTLNVKSKRIFGMIRF